MAVGAPVANLAPVAIESLLVAVTWPGAWIDVVLGNVKIALVAASIAAIRSDRRRDGLLLGVALALAPKPMFALFLVWMAVHRQRSLQGVVVGGLATTLVGVLVAGSTSYATFMRTLVVGVDSHFVGNYGLSYISPVAGIAAFVAVTLVCLSGIRRPADGLMAAAIAGTFAGTYIGLYSTILPLAMLPSFARDRPTAAVRVGMTGLLAPFALWVSGFIAIISVVWRRDGQPDPDRPGTREDRPDRATEPA